MARLHKNYNFRDLYAESLNQRTVEYGSDLATYCNIVSVADIKEKVLRDKIEKETQTHFLDNWRNEKLPPTGFYLFDNVNMLTVDKKARQELVEIYYQFRRSYEYSVPTNSSLEKAENLFRYGKCDPDSTNSVSEPEQKALYALKHMKFYQKLCQEALTEYFLAIKRYNDLADIGVPKQVIFLDHCLRFPEKLTAIKHVGKLRLKTRQRLKVASNTWLGF